MDRCSSMQGDFHLNAEIELLTHTVEAQTTKQITNIRLLLSSPTMANVSNLVWKKHLSSPTHG